MQNSELSTPCLDSADIINYLPVKAIVPTAESWDSLAAEWRASDTRQRFEDAGSAPRRAPSSPHRCLAKSLSSSQTGNPSSESSKACEYLAGT